MSNHPLSTATMVLAMLALAPSAPVAAARAGAAASKTASTPVPSPSASRHANPKDAAFVMENDHWRSQRLARLRAPDGWLSLVGLHWLDAGSHRLGSGAGNDVQLTTGPASLGTLVLSAGKPTFHPAPSSGATIAGKPIHGALVLKTDAASDGPSIVAFNHGSANFQVIERAGKFGLRVKDANAPTRTGFSGIDYFPADAAWRLPAKFIPHPKGRTMPIASVINTVEPMANPGVVEFEKDGKTYRLEALDEGDGQLFLIFADRTSGKTTYGAGRFLYADPPKNGTTVVDFNQAYNPPCVFTHFATCPLPPPENRLDLAVTAGEKKYAGAHPGGTR